MRIGSLFSGYAGLEQGVQAVLGGDVAWHSEIDPGACKILAHRYPDVPNLGDITAVDWSQVEPVDVLTLGFPCQDVSCAGLRKGLRPDTRSGLWTQAAYAIDQLRPGLVVVENVRGLLSAEAHSDLEPCPWCVGDGSGVPLRALGAVLGDLADIGYDASWQGLRAADVGAPHGRFRVFVVAWPAADAGRDGRQGRTECHLGTAGRLSAPQRDNTHGLRDATQDTDVAARGERRFPAPGQAEARRARSDAGGRDRAPAADASGQGWGRGSGRDNDATKRQQGHREPGGSLAAARGLVEVDQLVGPERDIALLGDGVEVRGPFAGDQFQSDGGESVAYGGFYLPGGSGGLSGCNDGVSGHSHENPEPADSVNSRRENGTNWGAYTAAVRRWEQLTRPAPAPTERGKNGQPRLSPAFVEWMQGLPAGWVTDVPGLTRNEQLKALGNGVVPQQAARALRLLLPDVGEVAA